MATTKKTTGWFSWRNFLIYGLIWFVIFMVGSGVAGCVRASYLQIQKINQIIEQFGGNDGGHLIPFQTGAEEQNA